MKREAFDELADGTQISITTTMMGMLTDPRAFVRQTHTYTTDPSYEGGGQERSFVMWHRPGEQIPNDTMFELLENGGEILPETVESPTEPTTILIDGRPEEVNKLLES